MMIDDGETACTAEKRREAEGEERERRAPSSSDEVIQKLPVSSRSNHSNAGSRSGVSAGRRGELSDNDKEKNNSPTRAKKKNDHSRPLCSVGLCTNFAKDGGVCIRHGATPSSKSQSKVRKKCAMEGCDAFARRGGVCIRHGATESRKTCSREGCINQAQRGGVCTRHGSRRPVCSREGCTKYAQKGGVCARHGASASRKMCSIEGCVNQAKKGDVCVKHGAKKTKTCSHQGCADVAEDGGVCPRHGAGQNSKNGAAFSAMPPLPVKHGGEKESFEETTKESARPPIESVRKASAILAVRAPKKGGPPIESGIPPPQSSEGELLDAASSCPDEKPPGGGAPSTLPAREAPTEDAVAESSPPKSGVPSKPAAPASIAEKVVGSSLFARAPSRRMVVYVHDAGDRFIFDASDQLQEESLQRYHLGALEKVRELCDPRPSGACAGRRPVGGSTTGRHEGDKGSGLELLCSALQLGEGNKNENALEEFVNPSLGVWEKSERSPGPNDAGDGDAEDEMGALIYDSSRFAEACADEIQLSSPVYGDPLASTALKRPPNSDLICDDASQLAGGDGLNPQSFGHSKDFTHWMNAAKRKASASLQVVTESKRAKLLPMPKKLAKNDVSLEAAPEANKAKPPLATKKKLKAKEKENKYSMRTYNCYDIFFIFEREKLLQSKGGGGFSCVGHHASLPSEAEEESRLVRENYGDLHLPPLPPRFAGLAIPDGWFIPRSQKGRRRPHNKTADGAGTSLWLVESIAKAWKEVDRETLEWIMEVEKELRQNQMRQLLHEGENNSGEKAECNENAKIEEGVWSESPDERPAKPAAETQVQSKLPDGTGVVHDKEITHDDRAPPSPVTSNYEPPSSATLEHAGQFEGDAAGQGKSSVEHLGPNALDAAPQAADDVPRSKEEELRTWMVDYFTNSAAAFNDTAEAASQDDAFEELRKYLSVMKCAETMRKKAAGEIWQRILPRLLLPSNSAGRTEWWERLSQQSCSYTGRPAPPTTGNDVSNHWYHDLFSPAQSMLDPEHVGPFLETEQETRILEETRGGNSADGPLSVADREKRR